MEKVKEVKASLQLLYLIGHLGNHVTHTVFSRQGHLGQTPCNESNDLLNFIAKSPLANLKYKVTIITKCCSPKRMRHS